MTEAEASRSQIDWSMAAQGDIIALTRVGYWNGDPEDGIEFIDTPHGIVLISQTCDLVQVDSKPRVLVAPIVESTAADRSQIRKGRRPLRILVGSQLDKIADLERITSVPRKFLSDKLILDRTSDSQSGRQAAELAERVGRGFSRFAFPDEVHEALRKFQKKITDGYSKNSSFAKVLAHVEEFRVACTDWNKPAREITIYALVPIDYLPDFEAMSDDWECAPETVTGLKSGMQMDKLELEKLSELILENVEAQNDAALLTLWAQWGETMHAGWLTHSDAEVESIELEVVSTSDFTYGTFVTTEALDFSILSHTNAY